MNRLATLLALSGNERSLYAEEISDLTGLDTGSETLVQQHFREETDINVIMARFGATGAMPSGVDGGVYGDFSGIEDFDSALAAVERARAGFMALPAEVRERFDNDPGKLIEAARSRSYEDFMKEYGPKEAEAAVVDSAAVSAS